MVNVNINNILLDIKKSSFFFFVTLIWKKYKSIENSTDRFTIFIRFDSKHVRCRYYIKKFS